MKKTILFISGLLLSFIVLAQRDLTLGIWHVAINRPDGKQIVFNVRSAKEDGKPVLYILNADEAMRVAGVQIVDDSIFISMPVFESGFKAKIISKDSINGVWVRASVSKDISLPFTATTSTTARFELVHGNAKQNVGRKWAIDFVSHGGKKSPAIGTFKQEGNRVTGSILTPFGDDRYLEGIVSGDSLWLSGFDGIHALRYEARITGDHLDGILYSGATSKEAFSGKASVNPTLPDEAAMFVKPGEDGHLNFHFKDMDGKDVSINDPKYKNKVVILDIMGSWCPNCMDETAFLSEYYNKNKQRGVEVIGLAYELTTDYDRSRNSLLKFQKQFDIHYPVLITGVSVSDTLRTEKTLPQLTKIKMFPTTIFLDKSGKVRKIDTGFEGPGTGDYYQKYVEEFDDYMNKLLSE